MDVLFLHGYNVTSTKTYGVLPQRLKSAGHSVKDVYLSKYVTLDNELELADLVRAFQSALDDLYGASLKKSRFACVTHSTGGLVFRSWLSAFYEKKMGSCPVSHLIMLAPPNHGSRLASLGKSRLSRLRSIWGVEPGLKILDALDLGSELQWELDARWRANETTESAGFFSFVIAGQWIDKKVWDVIVPATYERGSDGVVRVPSANLNHRSISVDGTGKKMVETLQDVAFLITPRSSHSDGSYGLMASVPARGDHPVYSAILEALDVTDGRSYNTLAQSFAQRTKSLQQTEPYYDGTPLDRYSQLTVRVVDQNGNPIPEYAVELINHEGHGDQFPSGFLAHSAQNEKNPEFFSFYLNFDRVSQTAGEQIGLRIHTVTGSPLVRYEDFSVVGSSWTVDQVLAPNQTTYVNVAINRQLNKNVFRLTKNLSYQKIERKAGPDWI